MWHKDHISSVYRNYLGGAQQFYNQEKSHDIWYDFLTWLYKAVNTQVSSVGFEQISHKSSEDVRPNHYPNFRQLYKSVKSRKCVCLVTWFCYHLIAKPGNKTAVPSWLYQSGRSPKVVALFSAANFSSYIIELLQLQDAIQIQWNYAWIHYDIAKRSHLMI